ncbi:MAG: hypothetical protein ASUL_05903 [Candidatus Aramenus sulfurataquae]|uniref:B box-type domain-containing protein n=1 Tax=Candidatus Aramenus sulfurataquae TaxID=1326980 RepID=W7KI88_9CREN|nr:MAG: hypothetical protein ASUL_05903 [Candidatus Aramenus sulfurataquae]
MRHTSGLRSSLCEICEEKESTRECRLCKRRVCEDDFVPIKGICKICEMSLCELCGERLSLGYCESCGRLVCQECTSFYDGSRRICKECAKNLLSSQALKH